MLRPGADALAVYLLLRLDYGLSPDEAEEETDRFMKQHAFVPHDQYELRGWLEMHMSRHRDHG